MTQDINGPTFIQKDQFSWTKYNVGWLCMEIALIQYITECALEEGRKIKKSKETLQGKKWLCIAKTSDEFVKYNVALNSYLKILKQNPEEAKREIEYIQYAIEWNKKATKNLKALLEGYQKPEE